jgi:lipid II isoglutaminyl synthase (glutamine-hydrolysing)
MLLTSSSGCIGNAMTDDRRIVSVFPLLAQPQREEGNARVLAHRARPRGLAVTLVTHHDPGPLPKADTCVIGGLEDNHQPELATRLRGGGLGRVVEGGAVVLAVNAGYQVLGTRFQGADGSHRDDIGLLDVASSWEERAEGPVITRPKAALGLPAMSGYECHHGRTRLGSGVRPLAALELGVGDGGSPPSDGAVAGTVVDTYLHGPVLARNPEFADLLLSLAVGRPLEPAGTGHAGELHRQRIAEYRRDPSGWGGRVYRRPQLFKRGARAADRRVVRS